MRQMFIYMTIFFSFFKISTVMLKDQINERDETNCDARCNDDVLVYHLASCEILSPESIINLSVKEIEVLCRKIDDTLKEIDKYLKTCIPPPPGNLFMSYIAGMKIMNIKMCSAESVFAKRFGPCYQCLHELQNEFESCSGPADWTEETDVKKICKTYKSIADCYYIKTAKVCGAEAASIMKELVIDVIDSVLCTKCKGIKSNPYVKDAMPAQYLKRSGTQSKDNSIPIYISTLINLLLIVQ